VTDEAAEVSDLPFSIAENVIYSAYHTIIILLLGNVSDNFLIQQRFTHPLDINLSFPESPKVFNNCHL